MVKAQLLALGLVACGGVLGAEFKIDSANGLIQFSKDVNSGKKYSGTTVFLDADIDFSGGLSEQYVPIGRGNYFHFSGTFDGQGHTIKNLAINSSSRYAGLFGHSEGATIRNVVLDSSCSVASSYSDPNDDDDALVGGIIGRCDGHIIENTVNMASVTFIGRTNSSLYLGGIAGVFFTSGINGTVKNCANYGSVTQSGTVGYFSRIGGVVGRSYGRLSIEVYIQNCLNYGTINHKGTTTGGNLYIGGIAGYVEELGNFENLENCVNFGKIISNKQDKCTTGSIVGYADSETTTTIIYCYWSSDDGCNKACGKGKPTIKESTSFDPTTFELNKTVSVGNYTGVSFLDALNAAADHYYLRDYSHWLLNKDNKEVSFTINNKAKSLTLNTQLILLPGLANEGKLWFDGWYTDSSCTKPLTHFEITSDTPLYGKWEENNNYYTITFDTRGGSPVEPITAQFGNTVELPRNATRDYCEFMWWENDYREEVPFDFTVPAHNITLHAFWLCTHITTADDLIDFSRVVSTGTSFNETTVFLDADIDFSGGLSDQFELIGKSWINNYFQGTFDGQGHTISNLAIKSSSLYVGLFGYSEGATIRNVVLDSSCSVVSSCSGNDDGYYFYVGGIIGQCRDCTIENTVNMASAYSTGSIDTHLYLGGIVGYLSYSVTMKNCANYGSVTQSGTTNWDVYIGGIAGYSYEVIYTQNCLNYGTINHNGTTTGGNLYIGGIVGDDGCDKACGKGKPTIKESTSFDPTTFELSKAVSVGNYTGKSLLDALNAAADFYYVYSNYSHWLLNKDSKKVSFTINNKAKPLTLDAQLILLPDLANEGKLWLDGWYTDSSCTKPLTDFEITSDTPLYGKWEENNNYYTITFDTRGGSPVEPLTDQYLSVVILPKDVTREHCELMWWENDYREEVPFDFTVPARNITLHAVWLCIHITTADDLITFTNNVNSGTSYNGTTVFLDADIDFSGGLSEQFKPIGKSDTNCFQGTFDGQGHTIKNLAMKSSSQYVGLFGYSNGATIRNVVLDSSCSVVSSYSGAEYTYAYVGGIVGQCYDCTVENTVNMASVAFTGNTMGSSGSLYLGGIVGFISALHKEAIVKSCANYGSVTLSGTAGYNAHIGGIVGISQGRLLKKVFTQNCLNYGTISHKGTTKYSLYIGGIAGYVEELGNFENLENCVNFGKIISNKQDKCTTGSIVGYAESGSTIIITYCYWTSDDSCNKACGKGKSTIKESTSFDPTTFELNKTVSVGNYTGVSLLAALNAAADHYYLRDYSHWLLNKDNKEVSFTINNRTKSLTLDAQLILLPGLANEGKLWFDGWYTDSSCTKPLTDFEITSDTPLYGKWEENNKNYYTITFDTRGGSPVEPITAQFGNTVNLPRNVTRDYCELMWWENDYREEVPFDFTVPEHNITLHAVWFCTHITTAEELITFTNNVNSGTSFNGTTAFLDADIDFSGGLSEQFEPIGKYAIYFQGVFDGQGHTIKNLAMNSSSEHAGLFGYSEGATIRNVVLDSSCSFESFYTGYDNVYVGGIIGECYRCTVENTVNMASVSFTGSTNCNLYIGGIVGHLYAFNKEEATVKNCANYGSVILTGSIKKGFFSGGIVGYHSGGSSTTKISVQNCLNYGTIVNNGTSSCNPNTGGIAACSDYILFENCVSSGKIISNRGMNAGSVVGKAYVGTVMNNCFWTNDTDVKNIVGSGSEYIKLNNSKLVTVNAESVKELDGYAAKNEWSRWVYNKDKGSVKFIVDDMNGTALPSNEIVLMAFPVDSIDTPFSGWFTDSDYKTHFTGTEISGDAINLYGRWCNAVIFDAGWGTVHPNYKGVLYGSTYGELPVPELLGHTFLMWVGSGSEVITSDTVVNTTETHTVHAVWAANNYTLTFDFMNGNSKMVSVVAYNSTIEYPPDPVRKGYAFNGWNDTVKVMPAHDVTIAATWEKSGFPWWAIFLIVLGVLIVVAIIAVVIVVWMLKKNKKKNQYYDLRSPINAS